MHALLLHLVSCCIRTKHEEENEEEQSLLPNVENLSPPPTINYGSTVLDHQKAKERLGVIIKSKKVKMVDVKYDAPFNLRNAPRKRERDSSSRSHRSSSGNGIEDTHEYHSGHRHTSDSMLPTPSQSRMTSPSPKPSPIISRSQSAASFSRYSQVDETQELYREPVLNARLVSLRGAKKPVNRTGRTRTKFVIEPSKRRSGDLASMNGDSVPGALSGLEHEYTDERTDTAEEGLVDGDADVSMNVEAPTSPPPDRPEITPLNVEEREEIKTASDDVARALREGFKIVDVGLISRGWGD